MAVTLGVGMQSGRSASRVSHARRGASPRHSHAERGNEGKDRLKPLLQDRLKLLLQDRLKPLLQEF